MSKVIYASFPVSDNAKDIVDSNKKLIHGPAPAYDILLGVSCCLLFLWVLWIHRFMFVDTTNGILMLLIFGGCGIWVLIDFINILKRKMHR